MLAEMLDKIETLVHDGVETTIVPIPGDPKRVFVRHGSNLTDRVVPPPLRAHKIASLPDFIAAIHDKAICPAPEVYFDLKGATVYCDRADRRESVALPIQLSDRWAALETLNRGQSFIPKDAIRFLRFHLNCPTAEPVIGSLRRVDFTRTSAGKSVNEHGRESLGKSVEAAVQGVDQIPECFPLTVKPVTNNGFQEVTVTVQVGVTIDFDNSQVVFRLLADELAGARESFLRQFGAMLRETLPEVPVFNGVAG